MQKRKCILAAIVMGFSGGPPLGQTGAAGKQTCWAADCHMTNSVALIESSTGIQVTSPTALPMSQA